MRGLNIRCLVLTSSLFKFLLLGLFLCVLNGCGTSRRTTYYRPSTPSYERAQGREETSVRVTTENRTTTSTPVAKAASSSARYPAQEYYGDSWNTDHIRPPSSSKPENVTLNVLPYPEENFVMPFCGKILSEFGPRSGSLHTGIDIKLEMNDPVNSAFDGVVRLAKDYSGYGKVVVVRHANGLETVYGHLNTIAVKVNQRVKAGERLGGGGRSGRASGTHLHFETRFQGEPFNPRLVVDFERCKLGAQTLTLNANSYKLYYKSAEQTTTEIAVSKTDTTKKQTPTQGGANLKQKTHVVKKGDTLYNISRRYGTTVDNLRELNKLSESSVIKIGQRIVVSQE